MMTNEQMEHTLKVMYEEIKQLKSKVKELDSALELFATIDLDGGKKRRDYWNVDNRPNR